MKDDDILTIYAAIMENNRTYKIVPENDLCDSKPPAHLEVNHQHKLFNKETRSRNFSLGSYPTCTKSLLNTTTRVDNRLELICAFRGTPNPTSTWYRNGKRIKRSNRVKKYFDGATSRLEISNVRFSDGGDYICEATNIFGCTRNNCKVNVLNLQDTSSADKEQPTFLQPLSDKVVVIEGYSAELQTRLTGTPPLNIIWLKNGKKVVDSDYQTYILYEDGSTALRFAKVHYLDAGEYTCIVENNFGKISCNGLLMVQDYDTVPKSDLRFLKTPVSVFTTKGENACFCVRIDNDKPVEIEWTINGRNVKNDYRCRIDKDGSTSILRINDVTHRDSGEVRCTAFLFGRRNMSISCACELFVGRFSKETPCRPLISISVPSSPRTFRKKIERSTDHQSIQTAALNLHQINKKNLFPPLIFDKIWNGKINIRKISSRSTQSPKSHDKEKKESLNKVEQNLMNYNEDDSLINEANMELHGADNFNATTPTISLLNEMENTQTSRKQPDTGNTARNQPAFILDAPKDVIALKGSTVILKVTYQGHPQPILKWLKAGRELVPSDRISITNNEGVSCLTLDAITSDQAGKYAVLIENNLSRDCRFVSVAVEGPPEPPAGTPCVSLKAGNRTSGIVVTWCSPPYDGGCALTGYSVEMRRSEEADWLLITETCHSLSHTVTDLKPEETYQFRVRAVNMHGASEPSVESKPITIPTDRMMEKDNKGSESDDADDSGDYTLDDNDKPVVPEDSKLFTDRYDIFEDLGRGRYGIVRRVTEKSTGASYAAKFIKTIKMADRKLVQEEMKIMNMLKHPKLLRLTAAFVKPREVIMVTEYISGGELFERVVVDDFTLTERDSILFIRQICTAVKYMHENNIVHLDLKPENIMCHTRTSHRIKIIDFGLAQILKPGVPIRVLFGTPEFMPPEIISYEPIGTESDMWSVGVICYTLLTGLSPFMGDTDAETYANVTRAVYDFDDEAFDAISQDAKDFISALLIKKKELRMSAKACLEHLWITQHTENMSRVALPTEKLKKFIVRRKWQKTGNAIRAVGRMAMLSNSKRSPSISPTNSSSQFFDDKFCLKNMTDDCIENEHSKEIINDENDRTNEQSNDNQKQTEDIIQEKVCNSNEHDLENVDETIDVSIENEVPISDTNRSTEEMENTNIVENYEILEEQNNYDDKRNLKDLTEKCIKNEIENSESANTNELNHVDNKTSSMTRVKFRINDSAEINDAEGKVNEDYVNNENKFGKTEISTATLILTPLHPAEEVSDEKELFKSEAIIYPEIPSLSQKEVYENAIEARIKDDDASKVVEETDEEKHILDDNTADNTAVQFNEEKSSEITNTEIGFKLNRTDLITNKTSKCPTKVECSYTSPVPLQTRTSEKVLRKSISHQTDTAEVEAPRVTGIYRNRFNLHTGNVSRTAKLFETKDTMAHSSIEKNTKNIHGDHETFQKAFAFWNK